MALPMGRELEILTIIRVSREFTRLSEARALVGSPPATRRQLGLDPHFGTSVRDASPIFVRSGCPSSKRSIAVRQLQAFAGAPIFRGPGTHGVSPAPFSFVITRHALIA